MSRNRGSALTFHLLFMAFVLTPLFAVSITAFTPENYLSVPRDGLSLRWFSALLHRADFHRATWLSVQLASIAATLAVVVAVPAALVLARQRFVGREALTALLMSPLMIPHVVLGIALLRYLAQLGVEATFPGLLAGHVLLVTPFALRLVMVSAAAVDGRLRQAAISLGAAPFTIFRRITLPLILPGIASGWILAFIVSFDEVAMTVFLVAPGTETLPLRMLNHIQDTTDPLVAAMSAVLIAGTAAIALLLHRFYGLDRLLGVRA
jgi:putative spermidine/putrescine transport system permease protein